tara:strand:- start:251 stop:712 length:462 start_codon:yes stop_codon:yes gene_type:complete
MESTQIESVSMMFYLYLFFIFTVNNMFFVLLYNTLNKEIVRVTVDNTHIKNTLALLCAELESDSESSDTDSSESSDTDSSDSDSSDSDSSTSTTPLVNPESSSDKFTQTNDPDEEVELDCNYDKLEKEPASDLLVKEGTDEPNSLFSWSYTYK